MAGWIASLPEQEKDALLARTAVPRGRVHNVSAEALCAYFHKPFPQAAGLLLRRIRP